jgi:hypothetical protein
MSEIYVSTDIEADGPVPGPHSMLSFGSAAYIIDGDTFKLHSTFECNLELLDGASPDPATMLWWARPEQQAAWEACREDLVSPTQAMTDYIVWLKNLPGKPVFVGYPAGFDFLFIYWYLMRFGGQSPFSFSALDVKSYAMAVLKTDYRDVGKRTMPARWFDKTLPHTHVALDDAKEQGVMFCNMLIENLSKK